MPENDRDILAAILTKFEELEDLYRAASEPLQGKLRQASGLSAERLRQSRDALSELQRPATEKKLFATLPESEQTKTDLCPQCAGTLETYTNVEPASQRGNVMVVTHYACKSCDYHEQDAVSLPKEIALQQQNLEALMKGV